MKKNCRCLLSETKTIPATERFKNKTIFCEDPNGCHHWVGYIEKNGRGRFNVDEKVKVYPERYAYELYRGAIPNGFAVEQTCDTPNCVNPTHLQLTKIRERTNPLVRFQAQFEKQPGENGCWIWKGYKNPKGYGFFSIDNITKTGSHRASYELYVGKIPEGLHVCHICDVPSCVNPSHLTLGTNQDNVNDRVSRGRQPYLKGEEAGNVKLTNDKVLEIRDRYKTGGVTTRSLATEYNMSQGQVHRIVTNKSWTHI